MNSRSSALGGPVPVGAETLYAVINTVSSSLDVARVLDGIVRVATEATGCHACFIYFLEERRLTLRAASRRYTGLVGRLELGLDEGLTGWVARTKTPEFIRDNALEDPRMKYVPELEEERFQSMVAVPVLARSGDVIGVIVLHTEAPREFDDDVLNFLTHTAALVAGAIENAQLYDASRRQVEALRQLAELSQALAAVTLREDLYDAVTRGARELLGAESCQLYRLDPDANELLLAGADPVDAEAPEPRAVRAAVGVALLGGGNGGSTGARSDRLARQLWPDVRERAALAAPLVVGDEQLGVLCCLARERRRFTEQDSELLGAVADQAAVGLKKAELIERLTAENVVKDMFDALAAGSVAAAEAKAFAARCDLSRRHVLLHAEPSPLNLPGAPAWPQLAARLEARLRGLYPRAFFETRHDSMRALVPLSANGTGATDELRANCTRLGEEEGVVLGLSTAGTGAEEGRHRVRQAADAARIGRALAAAGGALSYDELGAYKYLARLKPEEVPHDRYRRIVEKLAAYDRRRRTRLVETLEQFLANRCSVSMSARALYVHANTVRQRIERIERLTGLELAEADLLSLELALKLSRLHRASSEPG